MSESAPAGPSPTDTQGLDARLADYRVPAGHYDELLERPGQARPHWAAFIDRAGATDAAALTQAQTRIARQLRENGVTYNIHTTGAPARDWALDVLPFIVPAAEWSRLTDGLRQRARLFEAFIDDVYGPQRLIRDGRLPAAVVFGHPGFLRAAHGVHPASGRFLHLVAFDLARGPDGAWRVMAARAQAPSGAGYALENRLSVSRIFPDAFRDQRVCRLAPFFRVLQETLIEGAPCESGPPQIALLTAGRYNETYFEHAYLSRYLGFTLAEGADLTVRDSRVFLKTVNGLRPVHAILRRMDDTFCDPLELRADSTLGVPGLAQSWRAGKVLMANAFGTSVLESPALGAFLPALSEELLGEPLLLPGPETWWGGDPAALDVARDRLADLIVKPVPGEVEMASISGATLDEAGRAGWLERLRTVGRRYVLEERLPLSHAPVWHSGRLESRALMMRVFLVSDGRGDYHVMGGGLTRIAAALGETVTGTSGGGSKDTWVLSDSPVDRFSLLPGRLRPSEIARSERQVTSRAGEHLFWLGRYAERSENAARLLRAVLSRLDQGDRLISHESQPVLASCRRHGLLSAAARAGRSGPWSAHEFERMLILGLFDARSLRSVAYDVVQTVRVAGAVRDRLSVDNWRVLNQIPDMLRRRSVESVALADALETIDRVIMALVAVGGLEMAHMTRDDGWRLMSLGRHLERVLYVTTSVADVAASAMKDDPVLLEWLLDLCDSIITYRARYMGHAEWLAVADLLLFDGRNPRSAAFQLAKLAKHVPLLPGGDLGSIVADVERLCAEGARDDGSGELFPHADAIGDFLETCDRLARHLSDALTLRYFSHVYEPAHATLA